MLFIFNAFTSHIRHLNRLDQWLIKFFSSTIRKDHLLTTVTSALWTDNHSHPSLSHYGHIPHYVDHFHNTKNHSHHHFFTTQCFKVNNFLFTYSLILTKWTHSHQTNATFHIQLAICWMHEEGNRMVSFQLLVVSSLGTRMSAVSHEPNQMSTVNTP